MNIFRRHVAGCPNFGKRTGQKCPKKPPCPIHVEGVDGQGKYGSPKRLVDPRTQNGVRDWARACEIVRDLEAPTPIIVPELRTPLDQAIHHFTNTKANLTIDVRRKAKKLTARLKAFMEAPPRNHQFINEIRFTDLTDFIATWTGAATTRQREQDMLMSFFKFCYRAELISRNVADGLPPVPDRTGPKDPFEPEELERLWKVVPDFPDEYGRRAQPIAIQTEAFALIMRYTGLAVADTTKLEKSSVRGNQILTYRTKTNGDVWTTVPKWVVEKLWAAPHDSDRYFFWSGTSKLHTRTSKWFSRLRKLLNLADLQHRTPHNFRHHFAVELLQNDVPIDVVARLMGHKNVRTTEESYGKWVRARQRRLEEHLDRVRSLDPLNQRMSQQADI